PVLVKEVLEYLNIRPGSKIIDATLDGGGHTFAMAEKIGSDGMVLGIELDPVLFSEIKIKIQKSKFKDIVKVVNDSYVNLKSIVERNKFEPDGILFDLGLSSWHYEESGRGFSFKRNEILDMRFNPDIQSESAVDIVNKYNENDLEKLLGLFGEEQFARDIAKNIVRARREKPIVMTEELVNVVSQVVPEWYKHKKIHFATKTFQALRIAVNQELENIEKGIRVAIETLKPGGRLVVISFHGLEDKIIKNIFKEKVKEGTVKFVVKGTVKPSWEETKNNPRARSAKMKITEKI
ncbi:MAG: 16S rRNA (cytosine(1402)-N(4))-methyltransferase RsmH, partial [Candidatus Paceibacterota bacterium]